MMERIQTLLRKGDIYCDERIHLHTEYISHGMGRIFIHVLWESMDFLPRRASHKLPPLIIG